MSPSTVATHATHIVRTMGVASRAAADAVRHGCFEGVLTATRPVVLAPDWAWQRDAETRIGPRGAYLIISD